jgi:hypothetical protein
MARLRSFSQKKRKAVLQTNRSKTHRLSSIHRATITPPYNMTIKAQATLRTARLELVPMGHEHRKFTM